MGGEKSGVTESGLPKRCDTQVFSFYLDKTFCNFHNHGTNTAMTHISQSAYDQDSDNGTFPRDEGKAGGVFGPRGTRDTQCPYLYLDASKFTWCDSLCVPGSMSLHILTSPFVRLTVVF